MNPITADSCIGEVIDACPALEETVARLVPVWGALRNPVLRRTVARGLSVAQAAAQAGATPAALVKALREAAGQPAEAAESWLMGAVVVEKIDADAMLKTGVHPVGRVKERAAALAPGQAIELSSSFRPAPLIDLMRGAGYSVGSVEESGRHVTRFGRAPLW